MIFLNIGKSVMGVKFYGSSHQGNVFSIGFSVLKFQYFVLSIGFQYFKVRNPCQSWEIEGLV